MSANRAVTAVAFALGAMVLFVGSGVQAQQNALDLTTYRDNSFGAHTEAMAGGKHTVILFSSDYCGFCKNLAVILEDEILRKYGSDIVVSITDGERDLGARQLEEALGVVRYPTVVVLKPDPDRIVVAGRIEGEMPALEVDRIFYNALKP